MPTQERIQKRRRPGNDMGGSDEFEELDEEMAETLGIDEVMQRLDSDIHNVNQLINYAQGRIDQQKQRSSRRRDNCSC